MAHLWIRNDADWAAMPLAADEVALFADGVDASLDAGQPADSVAAPSAILRRVKESTSTWALITASPWLRLNGTPMPLGIAILEDRDEVRLPGFSAWFSTETLAHVEPFPESNARGFCPRCKQAITAGNPAVRCPNCNLWHHASEDLPCWEYAATCGGCPQSTHLDANFRWTPEDL